MDISTLHVALFAATLGIPAGIAALLSGHMNSLVSIENKRTSNMSHVPTGQLARIP